MEVCAELHARVARRLEPLQAECVLSLLLVASNVHAKEFIEGDSDVTRDQTPS